MFRADGQEYRVGYLPGDSDSGMFGGNSNWRGPVWFPLNVLIIRALLHFYLYYGDEFTIECPTGSGKKMNLFEVSKEIAGRLTRIFLRDEHGRRPVFGGAEKFQTRPALARSPPVLRVLPRRQRGRHRRQPPDRLDGARGYPDPALRRARCPQAPRDRVWDGARTGAAAAAGHRSSGPRAVKVAEDVPHREAALHQRPASPT